MSGTTPVPDPPADPAGPPSEGTPGSAAPPGSPSAPEPPSPPDPRSLPEPPGPQPSAPGPSATSVGGAEFVNTAERQALIELAKRWWLFLVSGLLWVIIALILMQFSTRSVATVGYITGAMLLAAGAEYIYVGTIVERMKWLWFVFGSLFLVGGLWAILNPGRTATALALSLGLLFALIGILWIIEGFAARSDYQLWWLTVVTGAVMLVLAIWAANQTTAARMVTLLTLATIWAMVSGITDIFRAFYFRRFGRMIKSIRG